VAGAQRASLAERVAALEQRAATDQGNVDLLNQVTTLKSEVQALRAQIEELQHQQQQADEAGRNQYLDLDGRLNRLEGGTVAAPPTPAGTGAAVAPPPPAAAPRAPAAGAPAAAPPPAPVAAGDAERAAYEAAFDRLKAGRYDESARAFQQFLGQFPDGALTPNAVYWLGESYYATQNYELAAQQFRSLLERFPAHDKAAGAMLKLALSQYGMGQQDAAEATLAQVVRSYPGTDAARTAQDRLQAMRLTSAR
jgi:tol-pal system protein YbgF